MSQLVQLDDAEHLPAIDREIDRLRKGSVLGRPSKLRDLFDYLVERSRNGNPPREVEIVQDVFGRPAEASDDGAARVYVHRLRRRLEDVYRDKHDAELRIALPLGSYRLVAEMGASDAPPAPSPDAEAPPRPRRTIDRRSLALGLAVGAALMLVVGWVFVSRPAYSWIQSAAVRRSAIWAPLLSNGRSVIVAEGDHYLVAEKDAQGRTFRLVRDFRIGSREELDAYLLDHPEDARRFADSGLGYVPRTVPRAQLYLSPVLLTAGNVRMLPASQLPDSALLSQNIVYLGLTTGLGPLRAPVTSGSRFALGAGTEQIRDTRTGRIYQDSQSHGSSSTPRRQYGLVSLFPGKEHNRFVVLAGTSEMGLVGLVETLADPDRLDELVRTAGGADMVEALYQVDSQGAGVLSVRLLVTHRREARRIWQP